MEFIDINKTSVKTKYIPAYMLHVGMHLWYWDATAQKHKYRKIEDIKREVDTNGDGIVKAYAFSDKKDYTLPDVVYRYKVQDVVAIAIIPSDV